MPKYFFLPEDRKGQAVILRGETAHHLRHVLRLREGARVVLGDGANMDYAAVLYKVDGQTLTFNIVEGTACLTELPMPVVVFQSLPKGDKFETVIQKCVELGAAKIIPVYTEHSLVKNAEKKHVRYQKIANAAAEQCMRGILPEVCLPMRFTDAVQAREAVQLVALAPSETLYALADEPVQTLPSLLALRDEKITAIPKSIGIWIGPEGGFSATEVAALLRVGAHPVSLGARVLRTETVAAALLAQISLLWG